MESEKLQTNLKDFLYLPLENIYQEVFKIDESTPKELIGSLRFSGIMVQILLILLILITFLGFLIPHLTAAIGLTVYGIIANVRGTQYISIDGLYVVALFVSWGVSVSTFIVLQGLYKILRGAITFTKTELQKSVGDFNSPKYIKKQ